MSWHLDTNFEGALVDEVFFLIHLHDGQFGSIMMLLLHHIYKLTVYYYGDDIY